MSAMRSVHPRAHAVRVRRGAWLAGVALAVAAVDGQAQGKRTVTQLADGVYVIEHADRADGFLSGNTTVIVGSRQVFVVDAGFLPSVVNADIAQIRQWTDKPVSFLLNTHFHNDHNRGNGVYLDRFPALTIVAQRETRQDMDILGPGAVAAVEQSMARWRRWLENGKLDDGRALTDGEKREIRTALAERRPETIEEIRRTRYQPPTLLFDDGFSVDIGNRVVEVKFLGRGNTAGDAVVYLPAEKIVVAGDLVVHPMPFIYDGYPAEWTRTLDRMLALDVTTVVPGHGPPLRDLAYVRLVRELLAAAVSQVNAGIAKVGPPMFRSVDDVRPLVNLESFRQRFAGSDKELADQFDAMIATLINVTFKEASLR